MFLPHGVVTDPEATAGDVDATASRRALLRRSGVALGAAAVAGCLRRNAPAERDGSEPKDGEPDVSEPALIAHRGCAAEHPENTVAAIRAAAPVADRIELDVRRCGTGELVVFHDERLDRVTNATGRLDRTPRERLSDLSVRGSGEPIPTLAEAFEAAPADASLMLDLKEGRSVADVVSLHADHDHELLLAADDPAVLREARAVDPAIPTAFGVRDRPLNRPLRPAIPGLPAWLYAPEDVSEMVERTRELGCAAISPRYELCLRTDLVERAHDADLDVFPWTIASRPEFDALRTVGVDAVVSDVCDGLRD